MWLLACACQWTPFFIMCLVLKGLLYVRYWTGIGDHFEACGVYSPDCTVLLCVLLRPSWQAHFTFRKQVNGVFTFSANLAYYIWNFISCKSCVLRCHLHVNAKMWGFCLLGQSWCPILYCLREVWTFMRYYWAGFLSWPFICGSFTQRTMPRWHVRRLCFTVSYVVTMLTVYVVIHKVLRVHRPSCLYHSWQRAHLNIAPNYLSKLRNSSCF